MAKRVLSLPRIAFHRTEFAGADVADGVARDCDATRAADAPPALGRLPCSAADAALFDGGPRTPRHAQERLGAWYPADISTSKQLPPRDETAPS